MRLINIIGLQKFLPENVLIFLYKYVYSYTTLLISVGISLGQYLLNFRLHNLLSQSQMETKGVLTMQEFAVSISPVGSFTITITYAPY